jgi:hypothetical protein
MTDFDYENMQKKITARGAYHKKNGSKSRRCTMPSDYMTKAQKEAMNGPVTTILLNQPMDWVTFKGLSDTLQKTYLTNLRDTYKPSASMMGRMFGCCTSSVTAELRKHGLPVGKKGNRPTTEQQAMWAAFCNGVIGGGDNVQPKEDAPAEEPKATVWDVDPEKLADALEEAKRIAEEDEGNDKEPTGFADAVRQHNLNLCDPDHPDHVNARRCEDPEPVEPDPDEELADAILDAFNKACEPAPCTMSKLATTMTGSPEGVVGNIRDLLSLFSVKVSVKLSIEVAE